MKRFTYPACVLTMLVLASVNICFAQWVQIGGSLGNVPSSEYFGWSLDMSPDGSIVAAGAPHENEGGVKVQKLVGGNWTQQGGYLYGESIDDYFGSSVSISADGTILAVGARYNSNATGQNAGQVYVYRLANGNWVQHGNQLIGEYANDAFGQSVALNYDGTILAVGANYNQGSTNNGGHIRVYQYDNGTWVQMGTDVDGTDFSGYAVSLSADGLIMAEGSHLGHTARVFQFLNDDWVQLGDDIVGENVDFTSSWFGQALDLSHDGLTLAIGGSQNDLVAEDAGYAKIFRYIGGQWLQLGSTLYGAGYADYFGNAISLTADGETVAIGAQGAVGQRGQIRIYSYINGGWVQQGTSINGGNSSFDSFGFSVGISSNGQFVAGGAVGLGNGVVRVYEADFAVDAPTQEPHDGFRFYPNPMDGALNITTEGTSRISLFNALGKLVYVEDLTEGQSSIDVRHLPAGFYQLVAEGVDGQLTTQRIVKI